MAAPCFIIIHGWQNNRPEGHWQHRLADALTAAGANVQYPQFPNPAFPMPDEWLDTLDSVLAAAPGPDVTVVAHSLGSVLWMLAASRPQGVRQVQRVLLVAPPGREALMRQPELRRFSDFAPMPGQIARSSAELPLFVGGDQDPWCPNTVAREYAVGFDCPSVVIPGEGHFALEDGYGPWKSIREWCLNGGRGEIVANAHGAAD
ncbi:MAG: alpha/beta hydrolase [Microbacteriaceae bacterium]|jgi:predicted alpha/beta hydrolase family esterase|nr:alpha/beta hydrolase [Microbacteriaceae bacterium]